MTPVIQFLPYQRGWIEDASRFKIGMFARQAGKTFSTCGECVDDAFRAWVEGRKTRWVILSRGERQAAEAMTEVIKPFTRAFYEVYNTLLKGGEPRFEEGEFRSPQEPAREGAGRRLQGAGGGLPERQPHHGAAREPRHRARVFGQRDPGRVRLSCEVPRHLGGTVPGHLQGPPEAAGDLHPERQGQQVLRVDDRRGVGLVAPSRRHPRGGAPVP